VTDSSYITEPIASDDSAKGFRGVQALDDFFAKHALANDRRGLGKTFVLRAASGAPAILGFYTLSMATIEVVDLPDKVKRGLPQYPVPVARIGRLATDDRARGQGPWSRSPRRCLPPDRVRRRHDRLLRRPR
jgi:hypothetical protein